MNYDKILLTILIYKTNIGPRINLSTYNKLIRSKKYINIKNYLINRYDDCNSIKESLYRIQFNINIYPKCPICGKPVHFNLGYEENTCYTKFCSIHCANLDKDVHNKQLQTKISKYGNTINLQKRKQTNLERYGVEEQSQRHEILLKQKEICIKKYGSSNNIKKHWYTIKNNKEKYNDLLNNLNSYFKSDEFKKKSYETKKKNKSFNKSIIEDKSYELLKEKYSDVIRQYKSELYPFCCDFYVPNYNDNKIDSGLYIECNYHWTHGNHLYDKNNEEDQLIVENWKEKNTKYYNNAIKIWTNLDIRKYNIAKENKLNYLIFYSFKEFNNWLK